MNCTVCGNSDVKRRAFKNLIKAPFGSEEFYSSVTIYCNTCQIETDETEDEQIAHAIQRSERNGLINITRNLYKRGIKQGEIERFFRLPFGTIERNINSTDFVDPSLFALLILIVNNPRMLLDQEQLFRCKVISSQEILNA
jgi:hypothetical protein